MTEERTLTAMHPALTATFDGLTGAWADTNGWTELSQTVLAHETSIDLSGYSRESLTFFPDAVGLQDPGVHTFLAGVGATYTAVQILDIITSAPMDLLEIADAQSTFNIGPGMIGSSRDAERILMGRFRFFTPNTFLTYPNYVQLERSQTFGSGDPTAADRLFCYRVVTLITDDLSPGSVIVVPAARQIIRGKMGEESERVYLQRLKRSYELANQV